MQVKVHQWQCFLHPHVPPSSEPEQKKQQIPAPARISCRLMACPLIYEAQGLAHTTLGTATVEEQLSFGFVQLVQLKLINSAQTLTQLLLLYDISSLVTSSTIKLYQNER